MSDETSIYTAVQEDATSFFMDWPVFGPDESSEIRFRGTVFVLDGRGARIGDTPLEAPSDQSADEALGRIGWARCGDWHRDAFGRQTARVTAVGARSAVSRQWSRSPARIASLAEEASLHLA